MKKKELYKIISIINELESTYKNDRLERADKMERLFVEVKKILSDCRDRLKPL